MEKNFNMGNGEEGGVFKMNDALFDDAPKLKKEAVVSERELENERRAKEMKKKNDQWVAQGKKFKTEVENNSENKTEETKEPNRHEIMRQKIAELNAKNEAWSQKVKEETDKNKKVVNTPGRDLKHLQSHHPVAPESAVILKPETGLSRIGGEQIPVGGFRADKKELSDKAKSMRAYEEKKARQEEEMLRDKTKYLEKYDTRMKGKTAAGKFISKMAGWLGFWDKNRVGRGEELKQKEGEFYNSLENYVSLSDRVSKIQSDILSGKRKNAKGETKEYSQEVLERYRAKMSHLELVRLGKEQKDVAGKRAETWNQIEENEIIEDAKRTWWSHPFRKAIGNRYVRFALMTGTIGALTGGVTSSAWLLGRGAKFGAGIVAGKLGQKGTEMVVTKLLNEEKFIRNHYNKIATDYANGNINAHEYDKQVEKISLQLNAIKNLLPTLVAGASAAGAGYGLSKLDASTHVFDKISDKVSDTVRSAIPGNYPGLSGVPGQIDTPDSNLSPIEKFENLRDLYEVREVSVPVSSDGSMQTFEDMRKALSDAGYQPGDPNNPSAVNFIFDESNSNLSKSVSYFKPGDVPESHMADPGDEYRINKEGELVFFDKSEGTEKVLAFETSGDKAVFTVTPDENAKMFDSGKTLSGYEKFPPDEVFDTPVDTTNETIESENTKVEIRTGTPDDFMSNEIGQEETTFDKGEIVETEDKSVSEPRIESSQEDEVNNRPVSVAESRIENSIPVEEEDQVVLEDKEIPKTYSQEFDSKYIKGTFNVTYNESTGYYNIPLGGISFANNIWDIPENYIYVSDGYNVSIDSLARDYASVNPNVDMASAEKIITNDIGRYQRIEALIKYGGFDKDSLIYRSLVYNANILKNNFDLKYANGLSVLKPI